MDRPIPYLSLVAASRNDDHGGDLLRRMRLFVSGWLQQCRRFALASELIIVEWNPPADRPPLAEVMPRPDAHTPCDVRYIQVSNELHRRFAHSDRLPLFQMIAKNVGIRRARAPFVLATNIDILFSDALMRHFARRRLQSGRMYRIDRCDARERVPDDAPMPRRLAYCERNLIRINRRSGTAVLDEPISAGLRLRRAFTGSLRAIAERVGPAPDRLHTNACGDFTLMSPEDWDAVRGYAEFPMYSMKIDGLLCYAAHFAGARETVLRDPMRIYHIEHAAGSGWAPGKGAELLNRRLSASGIPQVSGAQYTEWVNRMRSDRRPMVFNEDPDWGFAGHTLPETLVPGGRP